MKRGKLVIFGMYVLKIVNYIIIRKSLYKVFDQVVPWTVFTIFRQCILSMIPVICHVGLVICHVGPVLCHVGPVLCHVGPVLCHVGLVIRHEIFPEFSGIPEFSRPQRSFSWKSQIRFNIYGGGGGGLP